MKKVWTQRLAGVLGSAAMLAATAAAAWSDKPVKFLVPAPPGGTMDVLARVLSEAVSAGIGQPVLVDNRPGAGGAIAVQALLGAPADGQTLMVTASNVLVEIPLVLKLPYDPLRDLSPIANVAQSSMVMVAHPGVPANTLAEVIAYARANRGKLSYASYSAGTISHYTGLILNKKEGLDLLHVPYKGSPPALQDLMAGQVPLMFDGVVTSLPLIRSGKLKAYALASRARSPLLPNVPTFLELGYPDIEFWNWLGVVAGAKMAPELVARINAEMHKATASPKVHERLANLGFDSSAPMTQKQLQETVRADHARNSAIVKEFNIRFE